MMYAEALKAKTLALRKAKDSMATFMIAVSSKAKDFAKAENPKAETFEDEHALRAINWYVKGADDNIALLANTPTSPLYARAVEERALLKSFLPAEASDEEVRAFVEEFASNAEGMTDRKKLMGPVMKALNEKFGASLNKKTASTVVQSVLNG